MSEYSDMDDPSEGCPNCGGEGVIYMCVSEYACVDPEGGCDLCERRCDWCLPPASDAEGALAAMPQPEAWQGTITYETDAQVASVRKMLADGIEMYGSQEALNTLVSDILASLIAHIDEQDANIKAAVAVGRYAASNVAIDPIIRWMVQHGWLDAGNEYTTADLVSALTDNASQPSPNERVTALEWYPDPGAFPYNIWGAQSSFGRFIIEEVSASDSPAYDAGKAGQREERMMDNDQQSITVKIVKSPSGAFMASSPDIKGLLCARMDIRSLFEEIPEALYQMAQAVGSSNWYSPPAKSGWQPIRTAPRDGTILLLFFQYLGNANKWRKTRMARWDKDGNCWKLEMPGGIGNGPTHWMPLPDEPKL